ncbi:hypothetical protein CC80DRAFT_546014 [Byssothecium circinans]|uniref:GPI anchored protein n=1 Tax=Byssothecium circinans TaxID=147558 RepID=A0A6A5U2Z4_9PLEO|nr:hypothetical protein CC80DRAFT_546014 [Byssothecium circinans]
MYIATLLSFLLPLAALAEPLVEPKTLPLGLSYAKQYKRTVSFSSDLFPRQSTNDPELYCGKNYVECSDGFCCRSTTTCAGTLYEVPVCKDPTATAGFLKGTEVAIPYKDPIAALSTLQSKFSSATKNAGFGSAPTGTAATGSGSGSGSGSAAVTLGGQKGFGSMAGVLVMIWGAAAFGGARWFLL